MSYINSNKDQNWLMPLSIRDMIPEDHICFLIEDFVHSLDFSDFDMIYDGAGHPAYHPRLPMKILIQGMLSKERSSRKLANACRENFVFMYLAEKVQPDFRTICRFRRDNSEFIRQSFKETVKLADEHNLMDLSLITQDGSKIKAHANKAKTLKKESLDILDKVIDKMIEEDIAQDELDMELYGDREENLTGVDRKNMKKIVQEYRKRKNKEKVRENIFKAKQEFEGNSELKKVSLTDTDSRMMKNSKGYSELSYNAQFCLSRNQIIIANDVCQDGHDANQLIPQIKNVEKNIGKLPGGTKVALDSGFSSGGNIKFLEDKKLDGYIPSRAQAQKFEGKEETLNHDDYEYDWKKNEIIADGIRFPYHHFYIRKNSGKKILVYQIKGAKMRKQVPEFFRERLRMKEKMEKPESRKLYNLRKVIAEPVIGNIKQNLGFREFFLRGLKKAKIELNLVSIAHNLKKIWINSRSLMNVC